MRAMLMLWNAFHGAGNSYSSNHLLQRSYIPPPIRCSRCTNHLPFLSISPQLHRSRPPPPISASIMASLLTKKQIGAMLKVKRRQYVEGIVGLGQEVVHPSPQAIAAAAASGSPQPEPFLRARKPQVLVWSIKSLPTRETLAARKVFADHGLQLRKVQNGVVKSAARLTPFTYMLSGPCLIGVPKSGRRFSFDELCATAKKLEQHDKIKNGLLFTGMVHHNLYLTPKRLHELAPAEKDKIPSLVMAPMLRTLQTLNMARIPIVGMMETWIKKRQEKEGGDAAKA